MNALASLFSMLDHRIGPLDAWESTPINGATIQKRFDFRGILRSSNDTYDNNMFDSIGFKKKRQCGMGRNGSDTNNINTYNVLVSQYLTILYTQAYL